MRERYVIAIESIGMVVLVGTLIHALGPVSAGLLVFAVGLVVTAQIVKTR